MSDGSNAAEKVQLPPIAFPATTPGKPTDALHDVITLMNRVATDTKLALLNPDLAGMVGKLAEQATEPERLSQPSYRTGAAYAVQDLEKYSGGKPISMPQELRTELTTLAGTSPGLQNERMQALVAKTAELDDRGLVLDIRRAAQQVARIDPAREVPEVLNMIEVLERRSGVIRAPEVIVSNDDPALQAGRKVAMPTGQDSPTPEQTVSVTTSDAVNKMPPAKEPGTLAGVASIEQRVNTVPSLGNGQPQATGTVEAAAANRAADATVTTQPATNTAAGQPRPQVEGVTVSTSDAVNKLPPAKEPGTPASAASIEQRVNAVPSPGSGQPQATAIVEAAAANRAADATVTTQPATNTAAGQPRPQVEAVQTQSQGVAERIVSSTRNPRSLDPAPWSVPVPAIGQRIAQFEQRVADRRTERLVQNAEKSGTAMLAAMEQFTNGPGRGIMSKLEGVAAQDPGGMPAVIGEMRPGGRYATERADFDAALRSPAAGAAYKAVTDTADRFAADRYVVANNLHSRKLDPTAADGRFEQMDATLGEQASNLPGREAGKDAMAEMAQKLADLLRKAVAKVEQAFGKSAGVEAQATARPSPSPSASM